MFLNLSGSGSPRPSPKYRSFRPHLEELDERCLPSANPLPPLPPSLAQAAAQFFNRLEVYRQQGNANVQAAQTAIHADLAFAMAADELVKQHAQDAVNQGAKQLAADMAHHASAQQISLDLVRLQQAESSALAIDWLMARDELAKSAATGQAMRKIAQEESAFNAAITNQETAFLALLETLVKG